MTNSFAVSEIKIADLKPAKYNPRKISEWELRKLIRSIETYGFVEPVVVNKDMTIIGGHQRVEAAKSIGMESVPCTIVDVSKSAEKTLNLSLNRIGGEWDEEALVTLLKGLDEAERMNSGFDEIEIAKALGEAEKTKPAAGEGEGGEGSGAGHEPKMGESYYLGTHVIELGAETKTGEIKELFRAFEKFTGKAPQLID